MRHPGRAGLAALAPFIVVLVPLAHGRDLSRTACSVPRAGLSQAATARSALLAGRDVLGERLLAAPEGPTYAAARRALSPLLYARGRGGRPLTTSGIYYLPFAYPLSLYGEKAFALHVADGSELITRRSEGSRLGVFVGDGRERYGSCVGRLGQARLAGGFLPILRTSYTDANGVRYRQESFAGRVPGVRSLISFVRLEVDARSSRTQTAIVRLVPSSGHGTASRALVSADSRLAFEEGGTVEGDAVTYRVRGSRVLHAAWIHSPGTKRLAANDTSYRAARRDVERFWETQLARGATFDVPERRALVAQRNLLIQQLVLTWRYSIGNSYEELSFAEALDAAQVMAAYGFADVSRAILRFSLRRLPERYTNWRAGSVLLAVATHVRLTRDASLLEEAAPTLESVLGRLARQIHGPGGTGLLDREPYSSDIQRKVIALHGQAVAWQGLHSIARAWARTGHPRLATRATAAALRLERALRGAVRTSARRLPDGSLFVPAALLDGVAPFDRLTASREGSYWNLVVPYALASGLFRPDSPEARGIWRYMQLHGSRLLGLVRARADTLYRGARYPVSGIDQVYGLNVARFLADADLPDHLVLSLYGTLAGAMTVDTFVSGEAATVAPLRGARYGSMYLPPNGGTNTAYLENLRLMLVHERRGPRGAPTGLDLAFATPRAWLEDAKTIRVSNAPTSFGPVSYTIERQGREVAISVDAPPAPDLRLRLRLPGDARITRVDAAGRPVSFDAATGTVDLTGRGRSLRLVAQLRP